MARSVGSIIQARKHQLNNRGVFPSLWMLGVMLAAFLCMAFLAGCWHSPAPPPPPAPKAATAVFVGDAACAACHAGEYTLHLHTRHAQTLRLVSRQALGRQAPPQGKITGTSFVLTEKTGRFLIGDPAASDYGAPLEYALGSGKTGMTYVFPIEGERLVEMRMSYFPDKKQWYITPGQEQLSADSIGRIHPKADGQKCLLCHAVTTAPNSLSVEKQFMGVGCESCHGAGSAHVAAMRVGKTNALPVENTMGNRMQNGMEGGTKGGMENMALWPASRLNELCGKCHGTTADAQAAGMLQGTTNRLQPYGLMQSQCYKQSRNTLSCITCHNPHTNASASQKTYESVCLTCHSSAPGRLPPAPMAGWPCPVNPKEKCIGCHMPARQAIAKTQLPTYMADHFIRVFR